MFLLSEFKMTNKMFSSKDQEPIKSYFIADISRPGGFRRFR